MVSVVLLKLAHGIMQHTAHCNKVRADVAVADRAVACAPVVHYVVRRLERAFV